MPRTVFVRGEGLKCLSSSHRGTTVSLNEQQNHPPSIDDDQRFDFDAASCRLKLAGEMST
jgi:hypothetical protein